MPVTTATDLLSTSIKSSGSHQRDVEVVYCDAFLTKEGDMVPSYLGCLFTGIKLAQMT